MVTFKEIGGFIIFYIITITVNIIKIVNNKKSITPPVFTKPLILYFVTGRNGLVPVLVKESKMMWEEYPKRRANAISLLAV